MIYTSTMLATTNDAHTHFLEVATDF